MKGTTRAWIDKVEDDWRIARTLLRVKDRSYDGVCFHCQQSAEKFLKALLEECGSAIPRTHNLLDLHQSLLPTFPPLQPLVRGMVFLKQFAVEFRYPGKKAVKRQALAAVRWARQTRQAGRAMLGIKPPRKRRA